MATERKLTVYLLAHAAALECLGHRCTGVDIDPAQDRGRFYFDYEADEAYDTYRMKLTDLKGRERRARAEQGAGR
jgi:hypothetical protein